MHIRDENAAVNGLGKVLRDLVTKGKTAIISQQQEIKPKA